MRIILVEQLLNDHSLDNLNKDLSNSISLLMKENNISESDLARALSLPYNTIHRLISGHTADPRISTLKSIAAYFDVSLDSLSRSDYLLSDKNRYMEPKKNNIDEALLHYILKQSHHLYPISQDSNNDYADFVLGLLKEINAIDTSNENLLKIIDLAISSISHYGETRNKHSHSL